MISAMRCGPSSIRGRPIWYYNSKQAWSFGALYLYLQKTEYSIIGGDNTVWVHCKFEAAICAAPMNGCHNRFLAGFWSRALWRFYFLYFETVDQRFCVLKQTYFAFDLKLLLTQKSLSKCHRSYPKLKSSPFAYRIAASEVLLFWKTLRATIRCSTMKVLIAFCLKGRFKRSMKTSSINLYLESRKTNLSLRSFVEFQHKLARRRVQPWKPFETLGTLDSYIMYNLSIK